MPVWWPWVVMPVLRDQGVSVSSYARRGISVLELNALGYSNETVVVQVNRASLQLPHVWLLERLAGSQKNDSSQIEISGWNVDIQPSEPTDSPSTNSLHRVLDQSITVLNMARPWLHRITAGDGRLAIQNTIIEIPQILIDEQRLWAQFASSNLTTGGEITLGFSQTNAFRLNSVIPDRAITNTLTLRRDSTNWLFDGRADWQNNIAGLDGGFAQDGWLPEVLDIFGTNWIVGADVVGLDGYQALTGSFQIGWTNGHYGFRVGGLALPAVDNALLPDSININVAGQGTMESLAIETLNISTPALLAQLSGPLAIDFSGRMLVPETTLKVSAEFITEDRLPFTGLLEGTVTARPDANEIVNADFQVQLNRVNGFGLSLDQLNIDGAIHWPQLVVSNCTFSFPDNGTFTMNGELDLLTQVATNFVWSFNGTMPTNMLPDGLRVGRWEADGEFAGAWPELSHRTSATAHSIDWSGSKLDALSAKIAGNLLGTNSWNVELGYDVADLAATGTVDTSTFAAKRLTAELNSIEAAANERTALSLVAPSKVAVSWDAGDSTNTITPFSLKIEPLKLSGSDKEISLAADVNWPVSGAISLTATNVTSADFSVFQSAGLPEIDLREVDLSVNWNKGPVKFTTKVDGRLTLNEIGSLSWQFTARGDENGMAITPVRIGFDGQPAVTAGGIIPVRFSMETGSADYEWIEGGSFDVGLATVDGAGFWSELADRAKLDVHDPKLELTAKGDLENVQSEMKFRVAMVAPVGITNLPPGVSVISNVVIHATASRERAVIDDGRFVVAGQPARFDAQFPFEAGSWEEWIGSFKTLDWKKASGKFEIPVVEIASFDQIIGEFLRPAGQASVDVVLKPGGVLGGAVTFTNLATRSIEPIGPVRNIQGRIEINDRRAELKDVQAVLSGQPVHVAGGVDLDPTGLSNLDLSINATNVTLVRSVDLFLRGNLNLGIRSTGTEPPLISGEVLLHNSLLFQDIGGVMAIDLNQPAKRPPFFSVPTAPFGSWRLDVRVRGQKFLRVMSPVFKGQVSSGLQLGGTLKEPVALGEVSIETGQILFPFGTLDVTRGAVQLTRQDPHRPRVDFRGQGLNFGYNISLDVTGTADSPNIAFNSVPPLTTREIMLMLTAGEIPSGEYSYTDVDKASKLGYFLGKELINQVLGMETGEDKLLFRTGEYVTEDGQLTYRVEYKLINWISVFGEYTRFRDYNGGLKFNIYSR